MERIFAKEICGLWVTGLRRAMDHECAGWMGFEEVVDVGNDGDDCSRRSKESTAREAFDEGCDESGRETSR